MIFMLVVFVGGWTPMLIYGLIEPDYNIHSIIFASFTLLAEICLLIDLVNLYLFNHELLKYFWTLIPKCR